MMSRQIFISYRRDDSAYAAGRLYDRLIQHFGETNVFMDIDAIELGVNFREKIESAVSHCDVLIAMIGKQWLSIKNERGQRRLDDPNDFVRLEISAALKRNIHVIPVLVDGAPMPSATVLPRELSSLSERNGLEIRHSQFNDDTNRLIKGLESIVSQTQAPAQPRVQAGIPRSIGEKSGKAQNKSDVSNRLASTFGYMVLGVISGLIIGGLATTISGYSDSSWWTVALCTNILGGAIIGFIGAKKWIPILTGMFVGSALVLGFYAVGGEPLGDAVASALVLGCGPGGVLGAFVGKARSRKRAS
jgi:hypothetical protein